ncbi:hypothetical protein K431DRAFT_142045 [Polychaeton citri CBS 116435]|uniref:Uncharacterized protein n=1 Tax=Polychaeton citri CBS 116435 TaxID=1314669 RepID=A0A9P4Q435_9PEZI|nr:hypothetical protein K431DRAFT_142045 [Polychaeton citri CBS 116435]
MNQSQHSRSDSHGRRLPEHAKPSKPPPLNRRGHSYSRGHSHAHSRTNQATAPKHGPGWSKRHAGPSVVVRQEIEDDDFTDFLQYCANCEKQINNPLSTGLYCSEACRKTDEAKPTPLITPVSTASSSSNPFESTPTSNIIQPLSPTVLRPRSADFSDF